MYIIHSSFLLTPSASRSSAGPNSALVVLWYAVRLGFEWVDEGQRDARPSAYDAAALGPRGPPLLIVYLIVHQLAQPLHHVGHVWALAWVGMPARACSRTEQGWLWVGRGSCAHEQLSRCKLNDGPTLPQTPLRPSFVSMVLWFMLTRVVHAFVRRRPVR